MEQFGRWMGLRWQATSSPEMLNHTGVPDPGTKQNRLHILCATWGTRFTLLLHTVSLTFWSCSAFKAWCNYYLIKAISWLLPRDPFLRHWLKSLGSWAESRVLESLSCSPKAPSLSSTISWGLHPHCYWHYSHCCHWFPLKMEHFHVLLYLVIVTLSL